MIEKPVWWDYIEFYPDEDEENFDGVHYGGIKGLRSDTPEEIKNEYKKYLETVRKGIKL